jgi:DNA-binding transcriptional regulator YiaG
MAALIGVDASTIGSWEKNEHRPNKKALRNLEQMLTQCITHDHAAYKEAMISLFTLQEK